MIISLALQLSIEILLWIFIFLAVFFNCYSIYVLFIYRKRYRPFLFEIIVLLFFVPFFGSIIFLITNRDIKKGNLTMKPEIESEQNLLS